MEEKKYYYLKLELQIAKLYLFLLPIRMINIFSNITSFIGAPAKYLDFIISLLGLFLIMLRAFVTKRISNASKKEKLFDYFVFMITIFNISSLLMSIVIDNRYGSYAQENSYIAVTKTVIIYIQYISMIFYNKEIYKLLGSNKIKNILFKSVTFLLIIGYIQLLVILFGGIIKELYIKLDILNIFVDNLSSVKLSLTETEGALAGDLIAIFTLPFLAGNYITEKNNKKYIFQIIAWIPLIIVSGSLSTYILSIAFFITFCLYLIKSGKSKRLVYLFITIPIISIILFSVLLKIVSVELQQKILYTINNKITDKNNGSVVSRTIPLKYNIGAFKEYPIFGVGNGNQGFFYYDYVNYSDSLVPGVKSSYDNASKSIYNGALFFPSILSGYGIVGIILLIIYIYKSEKEVNENKKELNSFYYYYKIARIPILIAGFQTLFVGTYYIWFVLSIPYFKSIDNYEEL